MGMWRKVSGLFSKEARELILLCAGVVLLICAALVLSLPPSSSSSATPFGVVQGQPDYGGGYPAPLSCGVGSTNCYPSARITTLSIYKEGTTNGQTMNLDQNGSISALAPAFVLLPTDSGVGNLVVEMACQPSQTASQTCSSPYTCGCRWWGGGCHTCYNYYPCGPGGVAYADRLTFSGTDVSFSSTTLVGGKWTMPIPGGGAGAVHSYMLTCKQGESGPSWAVTLPIYLTSATLDLKACDPNGTNCFTEKTISSGAKSLLKWHVTNAPSCTLTGPTGLLGAIGLGSDTSGNSNVWKYINIDASDQVLDSPTNNFATLNQIHFYTPSYSKATVVDGGLAVNVTNAWGVAVPSWQLNSGKWYWEVMPTTWADGNTTNGVMTDVTSGFGGRAYAGHTNDLGYGWAAGDTLHHNATTLQAPWLSSYGIADVLGIAYDADTGKVYFSKNGVWQNNFTSLIPKMTTWTTSGVTMTASVEYSSHYAWKAGDGDTTTRWQSYPGYPQVTPQWLRVDFGVATTVRSYSMKIHNVDALYAPSEFKLQGNDNSTGACALGTGSAGTGWVDVDTRTNILWAKFSEVQRFDLASPASYRCYRLYVTKDSSNTEVILMEFGLYGSTSATPADGVGFVGVAKNAWPAFTNYSYKEVVNFGQGGMPQNRQGGAAFFGSGAGSFATTSYTSDLNMTGDYTIDLWAYPVGVSGGLELLGRDSVSGYSPYLIYQSGSSFIFYSSTAEGGWNISSGNTICSGITAHQWYHLAVVRKVNTYYTFCNGVQGATFTTASVPWATTYPLVLGRQHQGDAYFVGLLDEVRISNTARWIGGVNGTSYFTPSGGAHESDSNTLLLMHLDGNWTDSSSNARSFVAGPLAKVFSSTYDSASGGIFSYAPPAGFKALSTSNLPVPEVVPKDYFNASTYTGNGGSKIISTGFQPDIIWIKNRLTTNWHTLTDSVRGINSLLFTNATSTPSVNDANGWVTGLGTSDFTVGGQCYSSPPNTNLVGNNYISWIWKKAPAAGTDIVAYTGNGVASRAIPHSLGTAPDVVIIKRTDAASDWYVWSSALTTPVSYLKLNTTDAETQTSSPFGTDLIPTMTGATTNGVTITASQEVNGSQPGWKVADDNVDSYWETINQSQYYPSTSTPHWVRVNFGSGNGKEVGAYSIRNYYSESYAPIDFMFEGSNDSATCTSGGTMWSTLDVRDWTPWVYGGKETKTFIISEAARAIYQCYRVKISRTSKNEAIINELNFWSADSVPSATTFGVQTAGGGNLNAVGGEYVAYAFANREGYQKTGTYVGNAAADGNFIHTGFKPKFVMIKNMSVAGSSWIMYDTARGSGNPLDLKLAANSSALENDSSATQGAGNNMVDFLSNGFKIRTGNMMTNTWAHSHCRYYSFTDYCYKYVYIAFADVPFKSASKPNSYDITNSLRFDSSRSEYLSRTLTTAGNQKTWTWSAWVKRGALGSQQMLFDTHSANNDAGYFYIGFPADDTLIVAGWSATWRRTTQVFRDPSAWVHLTVSLDTTLSDPDSRLKIYVNGQQVTSFSTLNNPAQNATLAINNVGVHSINRYTYNNTSFSDGYLADVYFVDGTALSPTSFGAFDSTGYWKPKAYTGTYGTKGFFLNFSDYASLGVDSSGASNHWTQSNMQRFSQVLDTPTNNFATLNSVNYYSSTYGKGVVQAGGLAVTGDYGAAATGWQLNSGKWYWEYVVQGSSNTNANFGVFNNPTGSAGGGWGRWPGDYGDNGFGYAFRGAVTRNSYYNYPSLDAFGAGSVIGVAYDADEGKVYFSKNGVWQNGTNLIPLMTAQTTSGVTMTASNYYNGGANDLDMAWKAGDHVFGSNHYWYSYPYGVPNWLRVDFGSGKLAVKYSITAYASGANYYPTAFTLQGSTDANTCTASGTAWTLLDTQTNLTWAAAETKMFYIPTALQSTYRCYRINVTSATDGHVILEEIGLYENDFPSIAGGTALPVGIVKGGTPGLGNSTGKNYVNFGQGGTPSITMTDASSYAHSVVEVNNAVATSTVAKFGSSVYLKSSESSAVLVPQKKREFTPQGDYTIDLWVYPKSTPTAGILSRDSNTPYSGYLIRQEGSTIVFYSSGDNASWSITRNWSTGAESRTICPSISVNQWYHVAVVHSGTNYYLYCNGTRTTSFSTP